jgi:hypothetical protein
MDGLMETAEADRTETALADGGEGPRDLFGRGVRLVVSYIRMHPRPFAIAVIGPGKGRGMPLSACSPTFLTHDPNRPTSPSRASMFPSHGRMARACLQPTTPYVMWVA